MYKYKYFTKDSDDPSCECTFYMYYSDVPYLSLYIRNEYNVQQHLLLSNQAL